MALDDAIRQADGSGFGSLLCCVPGRLAYYVGEAGEQRLLLRRNAVVTSRIMDGGCAATSRYNL